MLLESELLPYTTSEIPEGPWLVFAPHPDDETFGMGGSLLKARNQQLDTHVVFVTDGALGGNGDKEALIQRRIDEATSATTLLGVKTIHFFGEPDRGLRVCDRIIDKIEKLLEEIKPRSVFFPTPMEYHPDHRVTAELVWKSVQNSKWFTGGAFAYEISTLAPINLLIDTSEVAAEKYDVVKIYASQLTQTKYLALVQAIDTARTFSLSMDRIAAEGFFNYADKNLSLEEQLTRSIPPYFEGV
ncbi:MAG: PIG-L family deacetylase [Proteobacteria bacterium]|nr:PIG-L family deacetylase [Pseudomonadota bacterium]